MVSGPLLYQECIIREHKETVHKRKFVPFKRRLYLLNEGASREQGARMSAVIYGIR